MKEASEAIPSGAGARAADERPALDESVRTAEAAFRTLDGLLSEVGGVTSVIQLYERVRVHLERIEYAELDRVAGEIRVAIERLLEMDGAVRKLNNLKVLFERERKAFEPEDR